MTSIRTFMTDDHRRCDDLFAEAEQAIARKNPAAAKAAFSHFRNALLAHFDSEEKTLFPTFEAKTGMRMGPTQVMRMEHTQMRDLLRGMHAAVAAADHDRYLGLSETLNMLMQQHNLKEENVLYPMTDQALGGELADLLRSMEAVSTEPEAP